MRLMRLDFRLVFIVFAMMLPRVLAAQGGSPPDGAALYQRQCASCHDGGLDRAPSRDDLKTLTPQRVLAALETGAMISMATGRSAEERRAIAEFVTGQSFAAPLNTDPSPQAMCAAGSTWTNRSTAPAWNGWGLNTSNTRF